MVGLFVVAAGVTAVAIPPALALGGPRRKRARMLDGASAASGATERTAAEGPDPDGLDPTEPGLALCRGAGYPPWRARPAAGRHRTRRTAGDDQGRRTQGREVP